MTFEVRARWPSVLVVAEEVGGECSRFALRFESGFDFLFVGNYESFHSYMVPHLRCVTCTCNSRRFPLRGQIERALQLV
mgnify:CR=1 FL=1